MIKIKESAKKIVCLLCNLIQLFISPLSVHLEHFTICLDVQGRYNG